jgi:N-acetylglutamate synthase
VLPLGAPGGDVDDAVVRAEAWYAERDLPSRFQVVLPPSRDPADDPDDGAVGRRLLARGYRLAQPTLVMTGATSDLQPLHDGAAAVTVEATLSPRWLETYARQRPVVPGVTEQVLTGSSGQLFLSTAGRDGALTAVARMSAHPGWAGLSAVWVDPERRGQGLGRTLLHAVGMLARQRRLASVFLEVEVDNEVAVVLYESEGFREHHAYGYLVREVGTAG